MNKKTKLNFLGGDFNGLQMTDFNNRKKVTLNAYKKKLKNNYNLKENNNLYKEKVNSFSKLINLDAKIQLLINERNNLLNKTSLSSLTEIYQPKLNNNIKNSKVSSIVPVPKFTNFDNSIMKEKIIDMLPVTKSNNHNPRLVPALVTEMIDKMTSEIKNKSSNKNKLKVPIKDFYNIITELLEKILPTEEVKNVGIKKNSLLQKFFPTPTRRNNLSVLTNNEEYFTESNKDVVISLLRFSLYVLKRDITIKRYYSSDEPHKYKYKYIIQKGSFGDIMGLISDNWPKKNGKPNWQADLLDLRKDTEKLISSKKLQEGGRIRRYRK
jgi:hypothetical protein